MDPEVEPEFETPKGERRRNCYPFGSSADPFFQDLGIRTYKSVPKRMADDGEMTDGGRIG